MIEFVSYNFASQQNERLFVFQLSPGSKFDEIYAALDDFKAQFSKKEEEEKARVAAQSPAPEVIEPEVVG